MDVSKYKNWDVEKLYRLAIERRDQALKLYSTVTQQYRALQRTQPPTQLLVQHMKRVATGGDNLLTFAMLRTCAVEWHELSLYGAYQKQDEAAERRWLLSVCAEVNDFELAARSLQARIAKECP